MFIKIGNSGFNLTDPNICPHCHVTNEPKQSFAIDTKGEDDKQQVISIWRCANRDCHKQFGVLHQQEEKGWVLSRFLTGLPKGPIWPKPIEELKHGVPVEGQPPTPSRFIKTYLQSLRAESLGLDELAGMGYRKAIEFLVKDWAMQQHPENQEKIEDAWLGQVIKDYFQGDLKEILERATWLGNDQAHYKKVFEDFDISILKELIDLIMVELDRQYKKEHYLRAIQKK